MTHVLVEVGRNTKIVVERMHNINAKVIMLQLVLKNYCEIIKTVQSDKLYRFKVSFKNFTIFLKKSFFM